jgi:hypothetical protein
MLNFGYVERLLMDEGKANTNIVGFYDRISHLLSTYSDKLLYYAIPYRDNIENNTDEWENTYGDFIGNYRYWHMGYISIVNYTDKKIYGMSKYGCGASDDVTTQMYMESIELFKQEWVPVALEIESLLHMHFIPPLAKLITEYASYF